MPGASSAIEVMREALVRMPLELSYADEQRDLQPHVQRVLQRALLSSFPDAFRVIISTGGTGKPYLRLLGTSFWPDVEVKDQQSVIAAVEVKLIRVDHPASKALAEAIGQSVIYSLRYPRVFTFVAHYGRSDERLHDDDLGLDKRLAALNIDLIVRRPETEHG